MKKLLKIFLIILMVITILPTRIWAEESDKDIVIEFPKNASLYFFTGIQERGYETLLDNGVLREENGYIYNYEGKQLILVKDNNGEKMEVIDGVGEDDNIEYTITSEDKDNHKILKPYNKIIVKFGKDNSNETDVVIEIEEGKKIADVPIFFSIEGIAYFSVKGIYIFTMESIIKNSEGKILFTQNMLMDKNYLDNREPTISNNIPNDITEEDDIIYTVTEEIRSKSTEEFGRDIFNGYDKVILNFSGKNYSDDGGTTLILNINETYTTEPELIINNQIISFLCIENVITGELRNVIQSSEGKELTFLTLNLADLYNRNGYDNEMNAEFKIPDDVGEEDTIIYELDDELKQFFPDNYQRLVIKFRKKAKENPVIPINDIIENPKTFNNILIVLGIIIMIIIGTTLPKLKDNK